ncbi:MAG TPA: hypothetical protein VMJ90_08075 [Anaerolineales bacterium]|nr:hypothetical protein [Anaerolineales bacterium]
MPTYLKRDGYLLVEVSEPYTLDLFLSTIHEEANRCNQDGLRKVLIDFSQVNGDPGIMDRYTLGIEIAQSWKHTIQGAGVARRESINLVMEKVAVNRGANVKAFRQRKDALKWLGMDPANEQTQA